MFDFGKTCRKIGEKINEQEDIIPVLAAAGAAIGMGACLFAGYIGGYSHGKVEGEVSGWASGVEAATALYAGDPRLDVPFWYDTYKLSEVTPEFIDVMTSKGISLDNPVRVAIITQNA